jgi:PTH1 family peptidyl-tRNA hydrolase
MISLLVGLGNPGDRYLDTRHNIGFDVIQKILDSHNLKLSDSGWYDSAEFEVEKAKIILALPKTYMNRSGVAVNALLQDYQLEPAQIVVVVDDLYLPLGSVRIRSSGTDGGHNGLESIITELETDNFPRLRLGVGPVTEDEDYADFVLEKFSKDEMKSVDEMIKTASEAAMFICEQSLSEAMTKYNRNPA